LKCVDVLLFVPATKGALFSELVGNHIVRTRGDFVISFGLCFSQSEGVKMDLLWWYELYQYGIEE